MKTPMQIIAKMYHYHLRVNTGVYTFGFVEGKYRFCYHDHSTGRDLRIVIISPDGDEMQIYDATEWYSSHYYFNGFGKGYVEGPWVKELQSMFKGFIKELILKVQETRKENKEYKKHRTQTKQERYNKFASICTT
jgi:hypothetical protein